GSVLVGHQGDEYVCTHEHIHGDDCLSFEFDAELAGESGLARAARPLSVLPPRSEVMILGELAQSVIDGRSDASLDEVAWMVAGRIARAASDAPPRPASWSAGDRRRAVTSALWIESHSSRPLTLERMSREAGLSPFHFLRLFSGALGVTPHQYLVRSRLRLAARVPAARARGPQDSPRSAREHPTTLTVSCRSSEAWCEGGRPHRGLTWHFSLA